MGDMKPIAYKCYGCSFPLDYEKKSPLLVVIDIRDYCLATVSHSGMSLVLNFIKYNTSMIIYRHFLYPR